MEWRAASTQHRSATRTDSQPRIMCQEVAGQTGGHVVLLAAAAALPGCPAQSTAQVGVGSVVVSIWLDTLQWYVVSPSRTARCVVSIHACSCIYKRVHVGYDGSTRLLA